MNDAERAYEALVFDGWTLYLPGRDPRVQKGARYKWLYVGTVHGLTTAYLGVGKPHEHRKSLRHMRSRHGQQAITPVLYRLADPAAGYAVAHRVREYEPMAFHALEYLKNTQE